ncbi:hypothetical protein [Comamonas jiangduensis]|uniref:hypothetical protein n=1 Tax=Comamonas jiangduensis TaxID=1194168 RepID=UPI0028AE81F1|nr:hypothetical protein [Comamonas jiangduensis]
MFLQRTPQALSELAPGRRSLGLRERSLLLLAEGTPLPQLQAMYHGEGAALVEQLVQAGYLQATASSASAITNTSNTPSISLAGVRMHMFDLCERMFANRLQDTAQRLRQRLREARDVDSMLAARDELLQAIHQHAGAERAETIRQQLCSLLPERSLETVGTL